jgi:hypothetical protein
MHPERVDIARVSAVVVVTTAVTSLESLLLRHLFSTI